MKIEVLRQHVEHRDEHGELDQDAEQAFQRVQRVDTFLTVEGEGTPRA